MNTTSPISLRWRTTKGVKLRRRPSGAHQRNGRREQPPAAFDRLERVYQSEQAEKLLLAGVMLRDPARFDLRGALSHGRDVEIDTNVILEGHVTLGDRVKIGAGCVIKNSVIGDDCEISPYSVVEDARLDAACTIGPFARLRPGAELAEGAHVGNFVEMKKARLGKGSKAGHLTYLGDAEIGDNVNIGAGTITCNYDGANKFKTIIGDDVFVGSDTQLVAPVTVGNGVTIAAGTTVTRDVAENELVLSRVPQVQQAGLETPGEEEVIVCFALGSVHEPNTKHKNNPHSLQGSGAPGKNGQISGQGIDSAGMKGLHSEYKLCVELLAQLRSVILLKSFSKVYVVWNTVVTTLPVWLWSMQKVI